jgi:hypothetical protein
VVGNEANNCQLDKNDHDGTQVDICDLVITHGDLLEEAWLTIQLIWVNKRSISERVNICLKRDNGLLQMIVTLSLVESLPFTRFLLQHTASFF